MVRMSEVEGLEGRREDLDTLGDWSWLFANGGHDAAYLP